MKRLTMLAALPCLLLALAACQKDFVQTSYTSLSVMANTYDAVMSSAGEATDRGLISEDAWDKVEDVALIYKATFDAASYGLEAYVAAAEGAGAEDVLSDVLSRATKGGEVQPGVKEAVEAARKAAAEKGGSPSAKDVVAALVAVATSNLGELTKTYSRLTSGIEGVKSWKR